MNIQELKNTKFEVFKTQQLSSDDFDIIFEVEGKRIQAHKLILPAESTIFAAMIIEQWSNKVPIKIENFCYHDFYQFLTFLYSGRCLLTNDNIYIMIDIAEFYQVSIFKDYCKGIRLDVLDSQSIELNDVIFEIDGKKLYAHKSLLCSNSTTFDSMLSDRWTSKDVPIPLDTYGYDDFYLFLTFLYSGQCQLTNENIFAMIDIAEFYQVSDFKDLCDREFSNYKCTLENVFQLLDIKTKYSLEHRSKSLCFVVDRNSTNLFCDERFMEISKEAMLEFIELAIPFEDKKSEVAFEKVYEWAEKQAISIKEMNSNLNLDAAVKEILADFMRFFDFNEMKIDFVINFIVAKSLIPSGPELSAILNNSCFHHSVKVKVEIIDKNGKIMDGEFFDPGNVYLEIQKLKDSRVTDVCAENEYLEWEIPLEWTPRKPLIEEFDGTDFYLVYDNSINLVVKRRTDLFESKFFKDFLIAEMYADDGFVFSEECKISASLK